MIGLLRWYTLSEIASSKKWMIQAEYDRLAPKGHPTYLEMRALQSARDIAKREFAKHGYGTALVYVKDGTDNCAHVIIRADGVLSSIRDDRDALKSWAGVPDWPKRPIERQEVMKRIPGGRLDIHAPPAQVHYVTERIDIVHQREVHHHHGETRHIEHGAPQDTVIGYDPTQVVVHNTQKTIVKHHQAPNVWRTLASLVTGPAKQPAPPQQHALPAPQAVDRGQLQALPAPRQAQAPVGLPAPREQPMPTMALAPAKKKSWL